MSKVKVTPVVAQAPVVTAERLHLREIKKEASRRCRARQKMIADGLLITPELAIRSLNQNAKRMENFKMEFGDTTIRLNKNGGEKVALVVSKDGQKTRKSFPDLQSAVKAFNTLIPA